MKQFVITHPALQVILKDVLHTELESNSCYYERMKAGSLLEVQKKSKGKKNKEHLWKDDKGKLLFIKIFLNIKALNFPLKETEQLNTNNDAFICFQKKTKPYQQRYTQTEGMGKDNPQ